MPPADSVSATLSPRPKGNATLTYGSNGRSFRKEIQQLVAAFVVYSRVRISAIGRTFMRVTMLLSLPSNSLGKSWWGAARTYSLIMRLIVAKGRKESESA